MSAGVPLLKIAIIYAKTAKMDQNLTIKVFSGNAVKFALKRADRLALAAMPAGWFF